ncbi:MAG: TrbG/VirB9 family P-type conjugative transfer protein [Comamonadaceae bacterium]|nr:TrbG/VirB9 family P-type conjugative transfer protein [Comamonadaceae bacterium]
MVTDRRTHTLPLRRRWPTAIREPPVYRLVVKAASRRACRAPRAARRGATGRAARRAAAARRRSRSSRERLQAKPAGDEHAVLDRRGRRRRRTSCRRWSSTTGASPTCGFPGNREVPAVFHVLGDGSETLVNARMEDDLLVVDRVSRRLMLRAGSAVVGVWNEAFDLDGVPPARRAPPCRACSRRAEGRRRAAPRPPSTGERRHDATNHDEPRRPGPDDRRARRATPMHAAARRDRAFPNVAAPAAPSRCRRRGCSRSCCCWCSLDRRARRHDRALRDQRKKVRRGRSRSRPSGQRAATAGPDAARACAPAPPPARPSRGPARAGHRRRRRDDAGRAHRRAAPDRGTASAARSGPAGGRARAAGLIRPGAPRGVHANADAGAQAATDPPDPVQRSAPRPSQPAGLPAPVAAACSTA